VEKGNDSDYCEKGWDAWPGSTLRLFRKEIQTLQDEKKLLTTVESAGREVLHFWRTYTFA
jgi:hypothetical protein